MLQIPNRYLKPIALLIIVSNRMPEKYGFEKVKRANPYTRIHLFEFGYHPDIQNGF
jgi:hypothetical protein